MNISRYLICLILCAFTSSYADNLTFKTIVICPSKDDKNNCTVGGPFSIIVHRTNGDFAIIQPSHKLGRYPIEMMRPSTDIIDLNEYPIIIIARDDVALNSSYFSSRIGGKFEVGNAYYAITSHGNFVYLRGVDLNLSDEELAKQFEIEFGTPVKKKG